MRGDKRRKRETMEWRWREKQGGEKREKRAVEARRERKESQSPLKCELVTQPFLKTG